MSVYSIEWFWDQMYAKMGASPEAIPPRTLSHFLDQAQRSIVQRTRPEDLPDLTRIMPLRASSNQDPYSISDNAAKIDLTGYFGQIHFEGSEHKSYYETPAAGGNPNYLFRELRTVEDVIVGVVTDAGEAGEAIVYHRGRKLSHPEASLYMSGDFGGSYYNEQFNEDYRWTRMGDYLYIFGSSWLGAVTPTGNTLKVICSFFPERFLDHNGDLKTLWMNDGQECELPSQYWPEMVDLAVQRLLSTRSGASGMQIETQTDLLGAAKAEEIQDERGLE